MSVVYAYMVFTVAASAELSNSDPERTVIWNMSGLNWNLAKTGILMGLDFPAGCALNTPIRHSTAFGLSMTPLMSTPAQDSCLAKLDLNSCKSSILSERFTISFASSSVFFHSSMNRAPSQGCRTMNFAGVIGNLTEISCSSPPRAKLIFMTGGLTNGLRHVARTNTATCFLASTLIGSTGRTCTLQSCEVSVVQRRLVMAASHVLPKKIFIFISWDKPLIILTPICSPPVLYRYPEPLTLCTSAWYSSAVWLRNSISTSASSSTYSLSSSSSSSSSSSASFSSSSLPSEATLRLLLLDSTIFCRELSSFPSNAGITSNTFTITFVSSFALMFAYSQALC
mmetsp:Transcript_21599/g.41972  ORF Transcript_21599/g.41972 Transcript_21599/m.41972 type:complete len:340 (+) Transcript_21599:138-1157(+)